MNFKQVIPVDDVGNPITKAVLNLKTIEQDMCNIIKEERNVSCARDKILDYGISE